MNKWKNICLFGFAVILQKALLILYGMEPADCVNFALSGVPVCGDICMTCNKLILWYLPIFVLFFSCSGFAKELTEGYAVLQITRGEKRGKLARNKLIMLTCEAVVLLLIHILVMQNGSMKWNVFMMAFLIHVLTILFFLFLKFFLELFLDSMFSVCMIQMLFITFIFVRDIISGSNFESIWKYFLLSNYAFAERNGVYERDMLKVTYELGVLFLGFCVEWLLIRNRYKKQDIL